MALIETSILVNQPPEATYALLKEMESFPRFISGIEQLKVRRLSKHQAVSEWTVQIDGTRISWKEKNIFDDETLTIKFKMLEGDFSSYVGEWHVMGNGSTARVSFIFSIDWGVLSMPDEVLQVLERKARLATRFMLRQLKRNLGYESIILQEAGVGGPSTLTSELVTYQNKDDQHIIGFFDHMKGNLITAPFVIIPPGYGETKRDALSAAYFLAKNGFNIIRYDATNHTGESEGEIVNSTLGHMKEDLQSTLDYVEKTFGVRRFGIVASSLAKRVALKAAAEDKRIALLVSLVGVVDLRETLRAVYKEDMIGSCLAGKRWGITDVLGFEVSGRFLETAITDRYHDLETTKDDVRNINIPIVFLVAENDAWVRLNDVRVVIETTNRYPNEMLVIPDALHHLQENPKAARFALRQIVASCSKYLLYKPITIDEVVEPSAREIAIQNKLEKNRQQALKQFNADEEKLFWEEYLAKYFVLIKSPDYRSYLADVLDALGPIQKGDLILDAGCGNGHFGAWLLTEGIEKGGLQSYAYVGVDLSFHALKEAARRHKELLQQFSHNGNPTLWYLTGDFNQKSMFKNLSFDKICCSLVLSYLQNPVEVLKELTKTLKPGGRIVVSSLKPHNDLSLIYRNFVDVANSEEEIREGRRLLSNAGKIKQKENEGKYQFFSKTELTAMLATVGMRAIQTQTSFGNQAYVVAGEKPHK